MKRTVLALLTVLLVFSVAVPALAQGTGHSCPHGEATISDLRNCFTHAVSVGHVDDAGFAQSLFAKLDAAEAALARGQVRVAVNILNALIREIEAQSGDHIVSQHAAHMAAHTQQVIDALLS